MQVPVPAVLLKYRMPNTGSGQALVIVTTIDYFGSHEKLDRGPNAPKWIILGLNLSMDYLRNNSRLVYTELY